MATFVTRRVTLTEKNDAGPFFDVYYSSDCITYYLSPTGDGVYLPSVGSSVQVQVASNTVCIKLVSSGQCTTSFVSQSGEISSTTTISPYTVYKAERSNPLSFISVTYIDPWGTNRSTSWESDTPKYFVARSISNSQNATITNLGTLTEPNQVYDTGSLIGNDSFITTIRSQIPELVSFINEKNLLTLDPDKPLTVRATPEYMRGVAGASISAPGPYDANAETYYNVTPLDHYSEKEAESYLREYNQYLLQILNIHEAIPGHYTQLVYSNKSPSLIKSILGNGAMIEGWAVYTELMMLENGYGNNDPAMWLMYYKWNLRSTCNTIIDYSIQVKNMQKDAVINLLTKEAFQQQAEAEGKWKRATLTQVQLCSYFTGFTEIVDLRTKIQEKEKEQFNLKKFHETFLSFGSAPVKYISELMN